MQIIVDGTPWNLQDDASAPKVFEGLEAALQDSTEVRIPVLDPHNRRVDLLVNGKTVRTVVLDADADPRPTEVSG